LSIRAISKRTVIDVTLYVIHRIIIDRILNSNRFLFAFTPVDCSTFNFSEKVASSVGYELLIDH